MNSNIKAVFGKHCMNLAAAVYMVLYDRMLKHYQFTGEKFSLDECRGFVDTLANEDVAVQLNEGGAFQ